MFLVPLSGFWFYLNFMKFQTENRRNFWIIINSVTFVDLSTCSDFVKYFRGILYSGVCFSIVCARRGNSTCTVIRTTTLAWLKPKIWCRLTIQTVHHVHMCALVNPVVSIRLSVISCLYRVFSFTMLPFPKGLYHIQCSFLHSKFKSIKIIFSQNSSIQNIFYFYNIFQKFVGKWPKTKISPCPQVLVWSHWKIKSCFCCDLVCCCSI